MRCYTTKPMNGGILFKCVFCDHSVATRDFDRTQGNNRTQAATAMNQHAKELHVSEMRTAESLKSGSRGAF